MKYRIFALFLPFLAMAQQRSHIFEAIPTTTDTATGEVRLLELKANGANYFSFRAPDVLSGNVSVIPFLSLPGSTQCVTLSATGQLATSACGGGVSSVTAGPSGAVTVSPTTGAAVVDIDTAYVPGKAASNTWTGVNSFAGATSIIPQKGTTTLPATASVGERVYKTDDQVMYTAYQSNIWNLEEGAPARSTRFSMEEEFCGLSGNYNFPWTMSGTPSDTSQSAVDSNHPCVDNVYAFGTNNIAAFTMRYDGTANGANFGVVSGANTKPGEAIFVFRVSDLSNVIYRIGLVSATTVALPTNGLFAQFASNAACSLTGSDTTWQYHSRSGGTSSTAAGPAVVANTWYKLRLRSSAAGTWLFSISQDGGAFSTEQSISTNVPSGRLSPTFMAVPCASEFKYVFADYFSFSSAVSR